LDGFKAVRKVDLDRGRVEKEELAPERGSEEWFSFLD